MKQSNFMRVACVQMEVENSVKSNLKTAEELVRRAANAGAKLIVLPEKWNAIGTSEVLRSAAQEYPAGEGFMLMRSLAKELKVWILAGSMVVHAEGTPLLKNLSVLIDPYGEDRAAYSKAHMFDANIKGIKYSESDTEISGDEIVVAQIDELKLGMSICYDLRFPELYRILALNGAQVLVVPAAFTTNTGRDHWEVLLRARAIENGCFVIAANVYGDHGEGKTSYGRSMIIDPWGVVLATAPDENAVITADLNLDCIDQIRSSIPSLKNRRSDLYSLTSERVRVLSNT